MKYAIIGFGKIGTALARVFARKNIDFAIANSRGPETLASLRAELGPSVYPQSIEEACKAEVSSQQNQEWVGARRVCSAIIDAADHSEGSNYGKA